MSLAAARLIAVLAIALPLGACKPADPQPGSSPAPLSQAGSGPARTVQHQVAIRGMIFEPAQLSVHPGDRIRWTNEDLVPHTATASSRAFDSSSIAPGASWEWTAAGDGEIAYQCLVHPEMKGSVTLRRGAD